MKMKDFKDEKPPYGKDILVKIKDPEYGPPYYVVKREKDNYYTKKDKYVESAGEEYACWDEKDLSGWGDLEDIER